MVARCYYGISLQVVKRIGMVASRGAGLRMVALFAGFHGGLVL